MIEVIGGKLQQWDSGRKIRLVPDGVNVTEFHFENNYTTKALVMIQG